MTRMSLRGKAFLLNRVTGQGDGGGQRGNGVELEVCPSLVPPPPTQLAEINPRHTPKTRGTARVAARVSGVLQEQVTDQSMTDTNKSRGGTVNESQVLNVASRDSS